jgi:hypothetical protein
VRSTFRGKSHTGPRNRGPQSYRLITGMLKGAQTGAAQSKTPLSMCAVPEHRPTQSACRMDAYAEFSHNRSLCVTDLSLCTTHQMTAYLAVICRIASLGAAASLKEPSFDMRQISRLKIRTSAQKTRRNTRNKDSELTLDKGHYVADAERPLTKSSTVDTRK